MTTYQVPCECGGTRDSRAAQCQTCYRSRLHRSAGEHGAATLADRFNARVDRSGGPDACHPWTGFRDRKGYGRIHLGARKGGPAHQVALSLDGRPVGDGRMGLHHCDNPPCCNPRHLYVGTAADNSRDAVARGRVAHNSLPGESHPMAKLRRVGVDEIRRRLAQRIPQRRIADAFGVSQTTVSSIGRGESWAAR